MTQRERYEYLIAYLEAKQIELKSQYEATEKMLAHYNLKLIELDNK